MLLVLLKIDLAKKKHSSTSSFTTAKQLLSNAMLTIVAVLILQTKTGLSKSNIQLSTFLWLVDL